ncbi:uncharacterized protein PAC_09163 [Phialocephala subalpina]|uniref:Uncharacterized protein n=1 Tax=Phialocephala subalpina TaxID=576137 RepID=A0A1L7X2M3_9HELO|nr:uncharacterized protein PAC_09163 [Phialocephala subalpina]
MAPTLSLVELHTARRAEVLATIKHVKENGESDLMKFLNKERRKRQNDPKYQQNKDISEKAQSDHEDDSEEDEDGDEVDGIIVVSVELADGQRDVDFEKLVPKRFAESKAPAFDMNFRANTSRITGGQRWQMLIDKLERNAGRPSRVLKDLPPLKPKQPRYRDIEDPEGDHIGDEVDGKMCREKLEEEESQQPITEAGAEATDIEMAGEIGENGSEDLVKAKEFNDEAADTEMVGATAAEANEDDMPTGGETWFGADYEDMDFN